MAYDEDFDYDIYKEEIAEEYLEDDEISSGEEGFMIGYLEN